MRGLLFTSKTSSPASTPSSTPSHHRTFSASIQEEDLLYAEQVIKRWDLNSPSYTKLDSIFTGDRREARQFIKSVNNLQSAMNMFVSESASSDKIIHAQKLMLVAMKRLEKEFYKILSTNRDVLDSESVSIRSSRARSSVSNDDNASEEDDQVSVSSDSEMSLSDLVMADLKSIADCMIRSGYGKECVKIYKILRKSIVDETMYNLGVEKYSLNQINKMDWEVMEPKIKTWLHAEKVAVKLLFSGERILCDWVFSSSDKIRESCFAEICKERAVTLFEFPELVAKSKKSMDRMFRTLDMYSVISEQWPVIETIFSFESTATVRTQAVSAYVKLGDAVRAMLTDFETAMQKETLKSPVVSGGIHPLTRYVMNYLVFLSDYSDALSDIMADWPLQAGSPLPESYFSSVNSSEPSSIAARFAWLVLVLLCKIDAGAELYKDVAQSYLFLINNLNYVVLKVSNSNLRLLIGEDWLIKHNQKVKQYAGTYERMAWTKVTQSLPVHPAVDNLSNEDARDCFRRFNLEFIEACMKQSTWVISDHKLRDNVKISLSKKILPAYRTLYDRYRGCFRGVDSVVRYAPDDLGNYLSDLFHGTGAPGSSNGSSHSSSSSSSRAGR
ncbi:exocyst complex component EXO70H1-like [Bidens hawaiensis]|uniref:exocyst complex component EXO70H1-like n=1 Tax=Bidens hawaiensis TaxID=980011 RepID=UPI00404A98A6